MNTIALDNRLGTHFESSGTYNACEALPIHQSTLTFEEMAGIDGLWDWGDALWAAGAGAVGGVATVYGTAAIASALGGPAGTAIGGTAIAIAAGTGALVGVVRLYP